MYKMLLASALVGLEVYSQCRGGRAPSAEQSGP